MSIQPHILCKKGDVAKNVILPGDPGRVLRIAKFLDNAKEISFNREYRVVTGKYKGIPVSICSTGIGGPSTAIAMEELIAIGAKNFIRVGSCGANQSEI
ncbi:MAG: uridine phosphorylase, partial [Patescibacteria group bacterium]